MSGAPLGQPGSPCPRCGTLAVAANPPGRCRPCGSRAGGRSLDVWRRITWLSSAYRAWSLGVFAVALLHLLAVGDGTSIYLTFLVLFPFGMALWIASRTRERTPTLLVSFLMLVDFGVIIAPMHEVMPFLHAIPKIPETQSRILTWYFVVYFVLQFVVLPPVGLTRSLRTAWKGGNPAVRPSICLLGLAVWSLLVAIMILGISTHWLK